MVDPRLPRGPSLRQRGKLSGMDHAWWQHTNVIMQTLDRAAAVSVPRLAGEAGYLVSDAPSERGMLTGRLNDSPPATWSRGGGGERCRSSETISPLGLGKASPAPPGSETVTSKGRPAISPPPPGVGDPGGVEEGGKEVVRGEAAATDSSPAVRPSMIAPCEPG